ncbi:hypothetical protein AAC387_Pa03g0833 [Persea americana]
MKKLFFFRSSTSSKENNNPVPPLPSNNDKVYWEKPPESQISAASGLKRSLSFSSPTIYSDLGEKNSNGLSDHSRSPSTGGNVQPHMVENRIRCRSLTPERQPKPKRSDQCAIQMRHAVEKPPNSSRGYFDSSGNSPYSSPVPLKCRAARLPQLPNEFLDLYIDGEQQDTNFRPESYSQRNSSGVGKEDGLVMETRKMSFAKRPPRVQSSAPASPTKERLRSYSFRESRDHHVCVSARDWARDDVRFPSQQKLSKNVVERLPHVSARTSSESHDFDSETMTTIEDIYEDCSEPQPNFNAKNLSQKRYLFENMCHASDAPYEATNGCCTKEIQGFVNQSNILEDGFGFKHEENVDSELRRKEKEAEERVLLLEEEFEQLKLQDCVFNIPTLLQIIERFTQDRRSLALEVSSQIRSRINERATASEALKRAKLDLDVRTRRLEREKTTLQSSLEKELDRRSSDWSFKLEKYQSEEQRLRDRVRELAEQNVSLQRDVSSLNSREASDRNRLMQLEVQLKEVTERLEEARAENHNIQQELLELQEHSKGVEGDRDSIRRSYKESENETKELQKVVARLQQICGEQEKTVNGLRQVLSDEIGKQQSMEKGDNMVKLQLEQVRLTGVEQMLRKEVDSYRIEVESLRHENISLLERIRVAQNGGAFSSIKLDHELGARIDCLQNQCLSLLNENDELCGKLLEFIKGKTCHIPDIYGSEEVQEAGRGFDGYLILEYDMKFQSLKRGAENLRRSLQTIYMVLKEKSELDASVSLTRSMDCATPEYPKRHASEGDAELELKAEILLTRVLREKLCHKELELEQLQAELATSLRGHDILRCENQRSQDAVSSLTHKMKDLELQMLKKDENISQAQSDLQECMKELTITRGILPKVTQERDLMWEEVKQYSEKNMLLNRQVISLRKRIEALEEDILLKEGQITILKDSIDSKPFDILCSPGSLKEFRLE